MPGPSIEHGNLQRNSRIAPEKHGKAIQSVREIRSLILTFTLAPWLLGTIWNVSAVGAGAQSTPAAARAPITVIDEVDHIPAPSWKAIPVSLPYTGVVTINVQVIRGNPIDVLLIPPDQFEKVKRGEWAKIKAAGELRGSHTKTYAQTGTLSRGEYYLVIGDRYLGEPPSDPSEIAVKVRLNSSVH